MQELRIRFGTLVAANRRRVGLTQEELSSRADISVDMISRIEAGATGARFTTIDKLARALSVDPAEFFTPDLPDGALQRRQLNDVVSKLAKLSDKDLLWVEDVLKAVLKHR